MNPQNSKKVKLLTIGMDKDLLKKGSVSFERHKEYAAELEALHAIVFAKREYSRGIVRISENTWAYPTDSKNTLGLFLDAYRIGRKLLREKGDWVISTQDPFESGLVGFVLAKVTGYPLHVQEHGDFFGQPYWRAESFMNKVRFYIGKRLIRHADHVRVVSKRIQETVQEFGVPKDRTSVAPVHTDIERFKNAASDPLLTARKEEDEILILTMGRFVPQKNLSLLIRAFTQMLEKGVKAKLLIVGKGDEAEQLHALAEEAPQGSIVFQDWTNDPARVIKSADVYALSSNYEGWARVCIEALAAGTPVLMTDVGCAGEVVIDGETGLVVSVDDEWVFTEGLKKLCTDSELRERLAKNGREIAESQPTLEESVALYIESVKACVR